MKILMLGIAAALLAGCDGKFLWTPPGQTLENTPLAREDKLDTVGVQTVVFTDLLQGHPSGEPAYLSTGRDKQGNLQGVSQTVINNLKGLGYYIVPATIIRPAKLGEGSTVLEKDVSRVYVAVIKYWESVDAAIVAEAVIQGGLPSTASTVVVRRMDGVWKIVERARP